MKLRMFVGLSAMLLLVVACAPVAGQELAGTAWVLQSLDGNTQVGEALGGQAVTISFADETQVNGSSGCNGYGGSYAADTRDGSLLFSSLVSTLMACQEDIMAVEQGFFAALNAASGYEISGDTLTITSNEYTLVFTRQ